MIPLWYNCIHWRVCTLPCPEQIEICSHYHPGGSVDDLVGRIHELQEQVEKLQDELNHMKEEV